MRLPLCFVRNRWLSRTSFVLDVCAYVFEFSAPFAHVLLADTLFPEDFTLLGMNVHRRSVFLHTKNETRNSHLSGEASGSSISNGCQAKNERRRQPVREETGREEASHTPMSPNLANSVLHVCMSLGTLF
ncbi:hypothetical protein NPIL_382031 [Nephila pilipes]|uniref:Uncharacterized protein n=1 Tax=Nephila pilipes TaxID=299642 RepID=A0A8X6Q9Y2_NEPPI|nr:hypothetical protein NPIL_382031 [Nephila pilipes]